MKKFYLLFAVLCTVSVLNAQIEVPLSDYNPTNGQDTVLYVNISQSLDPTSAEFDKTGEGVTWDFSGYTPSDTAKGFYVDPDSAANGTIKRDVGEIFSASFWTDPNNKRVTAATEPTHLLKIDSTEIMTQKTGSEVFLSALIYASGQSAGSPTWVNSWDVLSGAALDPTPLMTFPLKTGGTALTENDVLMEASEVDPNAGGGASQAISIRVDVDVTTNVVAAGTLKLPYGDLENVVLVHWNGVGKTADNQGNFPDGDADISLYQWYQAENADFPVAQAYIRTKSRPSAQLSSTTWHNMYYRTEGVLSSVEKASNAEKEFKLYPNPANRQVTVSFNAEGNVHAKAEIIDIVGQTVMTIIDTEVSAGQHTESVDISELPKGNYMIRAELGNEVSVKKLIVE